MTTQHHNPQNNDHDSLHFTGGSSGRQAENAVAHGWWWLVGFGSLPCYTHVCGYCAICFELLFGIFVHGHQSQCNVTMLNMSDA